MIRIDRTQVEGPPELTGRDLTSHVKHLAGLVEKGQLKSESFDASIYSSVAVRTALWEMQHHKCCFCEREYERKRSTVEHFRPKTEVDRGNGSTQAGYWWLAYDFRNLYFCCANCNQLKGCHFPLEKGSPALRHPQRPWPDSSPSTAPSGPAERPLLIDPAGDEPELHLTFVEMPGSGEWQIAPIDGSERGRETIRKIGLDRDDLNKLRAKHFKMLRQVALDFEEARRQNNPLATEQARRRAQDLVAAWQPFALLARVVFRKKGIL